MAEKKFYVDLNLNLNQLLNANVERLGTLPTWGSTDESRLIYSGGTLYYGDDTGWVDIGSGLVEGAKNGLTLDTNDNKIKLGGLLTESTFIDGDSGTYDFKIGQNLSGTSAVKDTIINAVGNIQLLTTATSGTGIYLWTQGTANIVLDAAANNARLQYQPDGTVDLAIATTKYVDDNITSAELAFTNGLVESGGVVKLGGVLIEDTKITGGTSPYELTLGSSTSKLDKFSTYSTNGFIISAGLGSGLIESDNTIEMNSDGININSTSTIALQFGSAGNSDTFMITDNSDDKRGLQYAADYSATFDNNSLVTKLYVDSLAAGYTGHAEVVAATDAELDAVTSGAGQGKTLTNNNATQAALVIDGITVSVGDRVLVKNQGDGTGTAVDNGIYTVTDTGSGSTDWVLTRAEDFDDNPNAGEVSAGHTVYVKDGGTSNAKTTWVVLGTAANSTGDPDVDVDDIKFALISEMLDYQGQGAIEVTGINISLLTDGPSITNTVAGIKVNPNLGLLIDATGLSVDYSAVAAQFAGDGLVVSGTGQSSTLDVVGINGITANANSIELNASQVAGQGLEVNTTNSYVIDVTAGPGITTANDKVETDIDTAEGMTYTGAGDTSKLAVNYDTTTITVNGSGELKVVDNLFGDVYKYEGVYDLNSGNSYTQDINPNLGTGKRFSVTVYDSNDDIIEISISVNTTTGVVTLTSNSAVSGYVVIMG